MRWLVDVEHLDINAFACAVTLQMVMPHPPLCPDNADNQLNVQPNPQQTVSCVDNRYTAGINHKCRMSQIAFACQFELMLAEDLCMMP